MADSEQATTPAAAKKYLVVELGKDNTLHIKAQSDSLNIAASEHIVNKKPGFPSTFLLKNVQYTYNVEEVQQDD